MFFKFFLKNFKISVLKYILLFFCTIIVIVLALTSNAIYIDYTSSYLTYEFTRSFSFYFSEGHNSIEVREKIYEFLDRAEPEFDMVYLYPSIPKEQSEIVINEYGRENDYKGYKYKSENYYDTTFLWFSDYRETVDKLTKIWRVSDSDIFPTEEQCRNDRVIILGTTPVKYYDPQLQKDVNAEFKFTDENHIILGGEEFLITGRLNTDMSFAFLPGIPQNMETNNFIVDFKKTLTIPQIKELTDLFNEIFADYEIKRIGEPRTQDLLDRRKSTSVIILTVFVQLICIFNILIIYKFIVDSRKKQFAVMRLCGFKKFRCLLYSWGELALITSICLPIAFGIFELMKPVFAKKYATVPLIFTPGYYLALGILFFTVMTVAFAVYIIPSFGKTVSQELREM